MAQHARAPVFEGRRGHGCTIDGLPHPVVWSRFHLPGHFRAASPAFHWHLADFLADPARLGVACCPRGHAKSTLSDLGYLLWAVAHKRVRFVLLIADTQTQAALYLDEIRNVCEDQTSMLMQAYPGLAQGKVWRQDDLEFANGVRIQALGVGQKVRGRKHNGNRPDLIIVDDGENDEAVLTLERRVKLRRWFYAAVIPALAPGARVRVVGTVLHRDSLLSRLLHSPSWTLRLRWKALLDDGKGSLWPNWKPPADLIREREEARQVGLLDVWFQEYQGVSRASEHAPFKPEDITYFDDLPRDDQGNLLPVWKTLFVDPALSKKERADFTGYTIVYATHDGRWFVVDAFRRKDDPSEVLATIERLHKRHKFNCIGVEGVGYQKALVFWAQSRARETFTYLPIEPINADTDKTRRILGLQPYFRSHRILIRGGLSGRLEEELLNLDDCDHEDLADSLAGHLSITIRPEPAARRHRTYADAATRRAAELRDRLKRHGIDR